MSSQPPSASWAAPAFQCGCLCLHPVPVLSGSILMIAHSSGSLLLSKLTFSDIHAPSTLLIQVTRPGAESRPADTTIEGLRVSNCTFYRGIVTDRGEPRVQVRETNFTGNQGAALRIKVGLFSDSGSVFAENTGSALCFFGSGTVSSLSNSSFRDNQLSETTGILYMEGPNVGVCAELPFYRQCGARSRSGAATRKGRCSLLAAT